MTAVTIFRRQACGNFRVVGDEAWQPMSRAAWHLLCDIIEMPQFSQYPDLLRADLRREMRSWTVVVDGAESGGKRWDVLAPNRAGMLAYHNFN